MRIKLPVILTIVLLLAACGSEAPVATPVPIQTEQVAAVLVPSDTPIPPTSTALAPTHTPSPLPPTDTPVPPSPMPSPSPTAQPTEIPQDPGVAEIIDAYLAELEDDNAFTGSVLVAYDGEVLLAEGYGQADRKTGEPNTPQTRFRICSVTKQFTAMAILMLQNQGKLDVQDSICDHITFCPADWKKITIHQLLTHTSGIPDFVGLPGYEATKGQPTTPEELISRFSDEPMEFKPGTRWRYSNSGYILLGYIIELASGQPYSEFIEDNIFEPLGMADSGYDYNQEVRTKGYTGEGAHWREADYLHVSVPYAAGALYSTVEDLLRWDQALYSEGLVPQALLDAMFSPFAESPIGRFGYGWIISTDRGRQLIHHGGGGDGFKSMIARYPDNRVTIILLSNRQSMNPRPISSTIAQEVFGAFP